MSTLFLGNHSHYNAKVSSTYRFNGAYFYISYGDGSYAGGHFDNDTVIVSRYKAKIHHLLRAYLGGWSLGGESSVCRSSEHVRFHWSQ
jgi:hypothetical protein